MNWADGVKQLPKQVVSETRAALIVGSRIELSDRPDLAITAKIIKSGDAKLKKAGLLKESRLYVLPRYD